MHKFTIFLFYFFGVFAFTVFLCAINTINVFERHFLYDTTTARIKLKYDVIIGWPHIWIDWVLHCFCGGNFQFHILLVCSWSWNGRSDYSRRTRCKRKCTDYWGGQRLWDTEDTDIVDFRSHRAQYADCNAVVSIARFVRLAASDIASNERLSWFDKQCQPLADGQRFRWHPANQQYDLSSRQRRRLSHMVHIRCRL